MVDDLTEPIPQIKDFSRFGKPYMRMIKGKTLFIFAIRGAQPEFPVLKMPVEPPL